MTIVTGIISMYVVLLFHVVPNFRTSNGPLAWNVLRRRDGVQHQLISCPYFRCHALLGIQRTELNALALLEMLDLAAPVQPPAPVADDPLPDGAGIEL